MITINRAADAIAPNETAVVVFTHGKFLSFDSAGNGTSGKWVLNPDRLEEVDKVIIYLRREGESISRIYVGKYAGSRPSDLPRRWVILFSDLQLVGSTFENWLDFAGTGQNPVSYVTN
jgi:hypothetical protein